MDFEAEAIKRIEAAIIELRDEGMNLHEGSLIDLARVLQQMVDYFKKQGIDYLVEKHWDGPTRGKLCKQKRLDPHKK